MSEAPRGDAEDAETNLKGTTLRVYRLILRQRSPVGISEVQKALGLSSPSVSQYHIKKLPQMGLIREDQGGYTIDRVVLENVIRIRKVSIPTQSAYVAFFGVTLLILVVFLRPASIDSVYFFAIMVNLSALAISLYEMAKTMKRL